MNIIEIKDQSPVVSHRIIAEHSAVKQRSVRLLIDKHFEDLEEFGHLSFEMTTVRNGVGAENEQKTYYLNEPQATLLMTYLQNTEPVKKFKKTLVKAFYELKSQDLMPQAAMMSLMSRMSESIGMMAQTQEMMLDRLERLERSSNPYLLPTSLPRAPKHLPIMIANCQRGQKWSEVDTKTLIEMYDDGYTSAQIGAKVGKSAVAVRCRLHRLFGSEE